MNTKYLIPALMCVSVGAQAGTYLDLHLTSYHTKPTYIDTSGNEQRYNNKNSGLGITQELAPRHDFMAGFFLNSYNVFTTYAALDYHTATNPRIGVSYGLVNGYDEGYIMVMPNLVIKQGQYRIRLGIIPSARATAITLTVSYLF